MARLRVSLDTIDKKYILSRVTQEEIFQYYLHIPVRTKKSYRSPLRKDRNPTCSFHYHRDGILRFRDWTEERGWDCFDIVKKIYGCNFYEALQMIARDFNLAEVDPKYDVRRVLRKNSKLDTEDKRTKSIIEVEIIPKRFSLNDAKYLKLYRIDSEIAKKFEVYSIRKAWINGKLKYFRSPANPCLGYYFGTDSQGNGKWKLYFYKSTKTRFQCNTNRINGWIQIPEEGEVLIITKSMKDVMVLDSFGIPSIAMQNETTLPYKRIIDELRSRFRLIYTLYDFDRTGIRMGNTIKKLYGIKPLFLFNGRFGSTDYGAKDISDYVKEFGKNQTLSLIFHVQQVLGILDE